MANWRLEGAYPKPSNYGADDSHAFIGLCGIVFQNQYTPWQGAWELSLTDVQFDSQKNQITFTFFRETKAGVKRTKNICVPVPKTELIAAREIASKLTQAANSPQLIKDELRTPNSDGETAAS